MKFNTWETSVDRKFMISLHNLMTTNYRKSDKSKYDRKLTKLDIVTIRVRYRVNGLRLQKTIEQLEYVGNDIFYSFKIIESCNVTSSRNFLFRVSFLK